MIGDVRWLVIGVALAAVTAATSMTPASATEIEAARIVVKRVTPVYPDLARKVHAAGKVKLKVVVTTDGKVKRVDVIGGHPLLVEAATEAAKQWLFAAAARESSEPLVFEFSAPE